MLLLKISHAKAKSYIVFLKNFIDVHDQQKVKVSFIRDLAGIIRQHNDTQSRLTHNAYLCFLNHFDSLCCMLLDFHLFRKN